MTAQGREFHRVAALAIGTLALALVGERNGFAQRAGDFNGDGYDDLAIGVAGENQDRGGVNVVLGSAAGLTGTGNRFWSQEDLGFAAEPGDLFGRSLAVGNFDGDSYDDLAIGAYGEGGRAGLVHVLRGSPIGLGTAGAIAFDQDSPNVEGTREPGDEFGRSLVSGDFDADGFDDLAIGVPGEGGFAGGVNVLYGSASGLGAARDQFWNQPATGLGGSAEPLEEFGRALATGDLDGDGFDDLAIGVPGEFSGGGAAHVLFGTVNGLAAARGQFWHQNSPEILGSVEPGDRFGQSLAVGDFTGDGFDDLAAGVPGESDSRGIVNVILGTASGLTSVGDFLLSEAGVDAVEIGDGFGFALAAGDANRDGRAELFVGIPTEDIGTQEDEGAVQAFRGTATGLVPLRFVTARAEGGAAAGDRFGYALVLGDFDGNGRVELAVGSPFDDVGPAADAGSITILERANVRFLHQDSGEIQGVADTSDAFGFALGGR